MADRDHTDLFEILRRQLREYLPIDLIVAESGLVPLEAQAAQPNRDVHQSPSSSSSSAFASLRSGVSKPSVNQPYTGSSRWRASAGWPWSRRSRARLIAARDSHILASCSRAMLSASRYNSSAASERPCRSSNWPLSLIRSDANQRSPVFSTICKASFNRVTPSSNCPAISHVAARRAI